MEEGLCENIFEKFIINKITLRDHPMVGCGFESCHLRVNPSPAAKNKTAQVFAKIERMDGI